MNIISTSIYDIDLVGRLIVLILTVLSVIAWGIVIEKIILFWRLGRSSARFLALYQTFNDWRKIEHEAQEFPSSPYLSLFRRLYAEFQSVTPPKDLVAANEAGTHQSDSSLYRVIADTVINTELMPFEKRLVILSSTISASPLLGLFGTVWGVMQAFMSIGLKGSAALTAIGPGIAVALITTIAGLAVAIPILFAYNIIVDKIHKVENHLQTLSNEMIQKLLRGNVHGRPQA